MVLSGSHHSTERGYNLHANRASVSNYLLVGIAWSCDQVSHTSSNLLDRLLSLVICLASVGSNSYPVIPQPAEIKNASKKPPVTLASSAAF